MQFFVGMPGGQRRNGRVEGGGVAEPGIEVAGGERAGHGSDRAGARERRAAHRRSSRACSRASSCGPIFTFGPAMWQCMSTPPGMTTMPRASIVRSGRCLDLVGAATTRPPSIQTSRTSPLHAVSRVVNGAVCDL